MLKTDFLYSAIKSEDSEALPLAVTITTGSFQNHSKKTMLLSCAIYSPFLLTHQYSQTVHAVYAETQKKNINKICGEITKLEPAKSKTF